MTEELSQITIDSFKETTIEVVNSEILQSFDTLKYDDIVEVVYDNDKNIKMLNTNIVSTNVLSRELALKIKNALIFRVKDGIEVPFGAVLGIKFFSGIGKKINLKVLTIKNVLCDFDFEFISSGINQTIHRIFLSVSVDLSVYITGLNKTESVYSRVLLCENLLIGNVPEVLLQK